MYLLTIVCMQHVTVQLTSKSTLLCAEHACVLQFLSSDSVKIRM